MRKVRYDDRVGGAAGKNDALVLRVPILRGLGARRAVVTLLLVSACGGGAGPASTVTTLVALEDPAAAFAVSAERALEGTVFEDLGSVAIADLVVYLCRGLGLGAIPASIEGLGFGEPAVDREILIEVLTVGVTQVCPSRASVDLTGFYLDAVRAIAEDGGALDAFDAGDVIRAGPVVCEALRSGAGVEAALLAVVGSLFDVDAEGIDGLTRLVDGAQGLVSGAVLASATALLCSEHAGEVEAFIAAL